MAIKLTKSEIISLTRNPKVLEALIDIHDFWLGESIAVGIDEYIKSHENRIKVLREEVVRLEIEYGI